MDQLSIQEFQALRETIRTRGNVRLALCLAGLAAWGLALIAVLAWLPNPIAGTIPLLLLLATFEVNRMIHLGVERIGRYLQVFYEDAVVGVANTPAWERTAMAFGASVAGAGGHPLLLPIFILATLINELSVVLPGPVPVEFAVLSVPHVAFFIWMAYADYRMRRQRAGELARYRSLLSERKSQQ